MKKIITIYLLSLILSNSFAQISNYHSPFGGTYTGDFKQYTPQNQPQEIKQQYKVEMDHIVLLNDDSTLKRNVSVNDLAEYLKSIEKVTNNKLNDLTTSNVIVLQISVNDKKHIINIAMKNDLNKKDNEVMKKFYKEVNKIRPFYTYSSENIILHLYFKIDSTLPKHN